MSNKSTIGIVGYGYVGKAMHKVFPNAVLFDNHLNIGTKEQINECDLAIICVPTPMQDSDKEFKSCDSSIVESCVEWLETELILIKSTVTPGTTEMLCLKYNKNVAFSPEYIGESSYYTTEHKYMSPTDPRKHDFVIIGASDHIVSDRIVDIFTEYLGPEKTYYIVNSTEAELIKYLENSFFALKVAFFNEFFDLCQATGSSYHKVREGWALDNRVSKLHTSVFVKQRQFGGKCFPKDTNAIINFADVMKTELSILKSALRSNGKR